LDLENNDVEHLNVDKIAKSFNILATSLNVVLHVYFDPNKLFSNLYLANFLDTKNIFSVYYLNLITIIDG